MASAGRLGRWPLEPRHVAAIRALDAAWCEAARKPPGNAPRAALTTELFDALTG